MTRLLFLDHEDSFSANLVSALRALGADVHVVTLERGAQTLPASLNVEAYAGVVLSPGPGHPREHPATVNVCKTLLACASPLPLLGVCLGLQCVAFAAGAQVRRLEQTPVHGRRIAIDAVFDLGSAFGFAFPAKGNVTLHNSLAVPANDAVFRKRFRVLAHAENSVLAAVREDAPWLLCQFHPESFGSDAGMPFLSAFMRRVCSPKATSL